MKWIDMSHLMSFDVIWPMVKMVKWSSKMSKVVPCYRSFKAPPAPLVWQMQHLQTWVETMTCWYLEQLSNGWCTRRQLMNLWTVTPKTTLPIFAVSFLCAVNDGLVNILLFESLAWQGMTATLAILPFSLFCFIHSSTQLIWVQQESEDTKPKCELGQVLFDV